MKLLIRQRKRGIWKVYRLYFQNLIDFVVPDVIVYFLHHIEKADDEWLKAKTEGEMLDSQLAVEGLFFIALLFVAEELALFFNQC